MMLRLSLGLVEEAEAIEAAIRAVIDDGVRTADTPAERVDRLGHATGVEPVSYNFV